MTTGHGAYNMHVSTALQVNFFRNYPSRGPSRLFSMHISTWISLDFAFASGVVLLAKFCAPLNQLLAYGKVAQTSKPQTTGFSRLIQLAATLTVPKYYFAHFYALFTVLQWVQLPYVFHHGPFTQQAFVWLLLTTQATRRAAESFALTQWGLKSRMHVSHYAVGILFYVCVAANCYCGLLEPSNPLSLRHVAVSMVFVFFSVDQFLNHLHLASLVKYSPPTFGLFLLVACAHYTDEIFIYAAVAAASWNYAALPVSGAFFAAWMFVAINLCVSGLESFHYYCTKFDDYSVSFAVIPYLI